LAAAFLVWAAFLVIAVIDMEHRLILHIVSLPSIAILGTLHALDPSRGAEKTLLGGAAGFAIVFLLYLLGALFSRLVARRRGQELDEIAFGFGDVTLATLIGVIVGWPGVTLAIMIGVLLAGGFSILYVLWMAVRSRYQPYLPFPYGPFLIVGAMLVYYGGSDLFRSLLLG
jgi:prepilin signal peptidase PulO-like enzyme (type II secretory pathway)